MFSRASVAVTCVGLGLILGGLLIAATSSEAGILDASWTAPTTDTDGSPLTDLASYRVYYSASSAPCPGGTFLQTASTTPSPGSNQTVNARLTGLTTTLLYNVSVTAVDTSGMESVCTTPASAAARIDFGVTPTGTVNFGTVNVGSTATQVFTVSNTGGGTVSGTVSTAAPFSVVSGSTFTLVGQGATTAVTVRFTPTTSATASVNVSVAADGDIISRIATGTGVAVADTTPPTAPLTLAATAVGTNQINLSWAAATDNVGVTSYRVERCQEAGCTNFAQIATPTGLSYNDTTGLQVATTYSYRVRAADAAVNLSPYSNGASATTLTSPPPPPPPSQGLVAAYAFGEGTGPVTGDGSGNVNQASISGATWTTQGKFGNALSFDGTSSFVSVPDAATLDLGATGTMEAWVKLAAVGRWNGLIAKGSANDDAAHNYAIEVDDTNRVRCSLGNGISANVVASVTTLTANQFYHLACTWDGTTVSLYIDGALNASIGQGLTPTGNTAPLSIGQFGGNSDRLSGVIDEVRIYNRALTLAQIQQDINAPVGGGSPPDTTLPTVGITTPTSGTTYNTRTSPLTIGGTASDNIGMAQVTWANNRGGSGTATGTTSWTAGGIALLSGANVLTVTARDAAGNAVAAVLTVTLTSTGAFTDNPLTAQSTLIKAVHIAELRAAINGKRVARGLASFAWTDPTLTPGGTAAKVVHLNELRTALNQAYQAASLTPPTYTDPTVVAQGTLIKASHLNELRTAVSALP
jgi:concanavalin A-like lectin/glucanase superfamily protein/HYDIN/CFA65/VesB family protein/fibronectin type III domain protein/Big-like domain-containing protein